MAIVNDDGPDRDRVTSKEEEHACTETRGGRAIGESMDYPTIPSVLREFEARLRKLEYAERVRQVFG